MNKDVVAVEVLDQAFATNQRTTIRLTYSAGQEGPPSLFVKLAPLDPAHRKMIGADAMGAREAQFYTDVAPSIDLRVPQACYVGTAENGDFVLVLEDLAARGCAFSDGSWGVSSDAASVALEDLAHFHARFEDPAVRAKATPWMDVPRPRQSDAIVQLLRSVLDQHRGELTPAYVATGDMYVEHHRQIDALWDAGPQSYIHGDPHIGNVFLDGGRVGFFDWGLSRVSTPLRDVSYFLTMTVEPAERQRSERELLRLYVDAYRSAGGTEISFDEAWLAHRIQAAYTVLATFLAFMPSYAVSDAQTLGRALLMHAELALDDLDVVDALKTSLA